MMPSSPRNPVRGNKQKPSVSFVRRLSPSSEPPSPSLRVSAATLRLDSRSFNRSDHAKPFSQCRPAWYWWYFIVSHQYDTRRHILLAGFIRPRWPFVFRTDTSTTSYHGNGRFLAYCSCWVGYYWHPHFILDGKSSKITRSWRKTVETDFCFRRNRRNTWIKAG